MSVDTEETLHEHSIVTFLHCSKCVKEVPEDVSPRDSFRVECGMSGSKFIVWCIRHEEIVLAFTPSQLAVFIKQLNDGEMVCDECGKSALDHREH